MLQASRSGIALSAEGESILAAQKPGPDNLCPLEKLCYYSVFYSLLGEQHTVFKISPRFLILNPCAKPAGERPLGRKAA